MLERAAKLQANAAKQAEHQPGLTLTELEAIAAEAGLDPIHLRQAASEMFDASISLSSRNKSSNAIFNFVDQWIVGELTEDSWEEVESELRHRFESDLGQAMSAGTGYGVGKSRKIGRSKEWSHVSMSGIETKVIVQPRGESMHLKLSQRVGWGGPMAESMTYGFVASSLIGLIAGKIASSGLIGLLGVAVGMLVLVPLILYADRTWRKKKHKELEEVADKLVGILAAHQPEKTPEPSMTYEDTTESRIDQSLLEEESEQPSSATAQRNRERQ